VHDRLELTSRLQLLADWVPQDARFADIGTDHGYLPVWLLMNGRVGRAIATDLRPGPLSRAKSTAEKYGVAPRMELRLGGGLSPVAPDEADVLAIAGMGGENIAAILASAPWSSDGAHQFLLQPMSRAEVLRGYLAEHGYLIRREQLVMDRGTIYPVMLVSAGEMHLSAGQLYGGAGLLEDPLEDRYLNEWILRHMNVVCGLRRSSLPDGAAQADSLREIIRELLTMKEMRRRADSCGN